MFRRNSAKVNSLPHHVDEPVSDAGQHGLSPTILSLLAIASSLSAVSGLAAAADDVDRAGPFSSRGRASGNLVSGYLGAIERHRRRFSRAHVDVLLRKLGDDFNADLMSIEKPSLNLTRTVSSIFVCHHRHHHHFYHSSSFLSFTPDLRPTFPQIIPVIVSKS